MLKPTKSRQCRQNNTNIVPIDGIVRISAMRCHSQRLDHQNQTKVPLEEIEAALRNSDNEWLDVVENDKAASVERLTPVAVFRLL